MSSWGNMHASMRIVFVAEFQLFFLFRNWAKRNGCSRLICKRPTSLWKGTNFRYLCLSGIWQRLLSRNCMRNLIMTMVSSNCFAPVSLRLCSPSRYWRNHTVRRACHMEPVAWWHLKSSVVLTCPEVQMESLLLILDDCLINSPFVLNLLHAYGPSLALRIV